VDFAVGRDIRSDARSQSSSHLMAAVVVSPAPPVHHFLWLPTVAHRAIFCYGNLLSVSFCTLHNSCQEFLFLLLAVNACK